MDWAAARKRDLTAQLLAQAGHNPIADSYIAGCVAVLEELLHLDLVIVSREEKEFDD